MPLNSLENSNSCCSCKGLCCANCRKPYFPGCAVKMRSAWPFDPVATQHASSTACPASVMTTMQVVDEACPAHLSLYQHKSSQPECLLIRAIEWDLLCYFHKEHNEKLEKSTEIAMHHYMFEEEQTIIKLHSANISCVESVRDHINFESQISLGFHLFCF